MVYCGGLAIPPDRHVTTCRLFLDQVPVPDLPALITSLFLSGSVLDLTLSSPRHPPKRIPWVPAALPAIGTCAGRLPVHMLVGPLGSSRAADRRCWASRGLNLMLAVAHLSSLLAKSSTSIPSTIHVTSSTEDMCNGARRV